MPLDSRPRADLATLREIRRRIDAYLADEMSALGADGASLAEEIAGMSGLEVWSQWLAPTPPVPPALAILLGFEWREVEPGEVSLALELAPWMLNPYGTVHGGILATLLDTVLGAAVHTTLPAGVGCPTSDLHVRLVRPVTATSGRLVASARAVHCGKRHATAEGVVTSHDSGKPIATATAGVAILGAAG